MTRIAILAAMLLWSPPAMAAFQVFACEPEWASLAEEIGGGHVEVFAATTARQDPHYVRARPGLIAAMRRADLVICSGGGLESGWLPLLLQKAGKASLQRGSAGSLMAAEHVTLRDRPARLDRSQGDVHPEGNPHLHLDPRNILAVSKVLAARLAALDEANAAAYRQNADTFDRRWRKAMAGWEAEGTGLRGMRVVTHHASFTYLLRWLGLDQAGMMEPKPGIPPSASHLEGLLQRLKAEPAAMILRTPYDAADASEWLAERSGLPSVQLPYTVGGDAESSDLFALFDRSIALLKAGHAQR